MVRAAADSVAGARGVRSEIEAPASVVSRALLVRRARGPQKPAAIEADAAAFLVPIGQVHPGPNTRSQWDAVDEKLQQLADSVQEKGILEPLLVREIRSHTDSSGPRQFELIAGFRRFAAARHLSLARVPVRVIAASDDEAVALNLAENLARENLPDADALRGVEQLQETYHWGVRKISRVTGRSASWVSELLAVARSREERRAVESGLIALSGAARMVRLKERFPDVRGILLERVSAGHAVQVEDVPRIRDLQSAGKQAVEAMDAAADAGSVSPAVAAAGAPPQTLELGVTELSLIRNMRWTVRSALASLHKSWRTQGGRALPTEVRDLLYHARCEIDTVLSQDAAALDGTGAAPSTPSA
jgi:ParB family chromosome partitioning protein